MTTTARPIQRLIDACDPLFVLVLQLQQLSDPGPADALRVRVNQLLETLSSEARGVGATEEAIAAARYAAVALVDEVALTSSWPLKDVWLGRPLQLEHFNSFAAGEEFFTRLEAVRVGADPRRLELLEVFATCLSLGFRGKHVGVQGLEALRGLQRALLEELAGAAPQLAPQQTATPTDLALGRARRKLDATGLAPAWRPPNEPLLSNLPKELPVRLVAVTCLALVVVIYALLAAALRHGTSSALGS